MLWDHNAQTVVILTDMSEDTVGYFIFFSYRIHLFKLFNLIRNIYLYFIIGIAY